MLKALLSVIALLTVTQASFAASVTGAEVVEYGVFEKVSSIGHRKAEGVLTGQIDQVPEVKLKQQTNTVLAALGTNFGITVRLTGNPVGEMVNCSIRWIHPKLVNPSSGQVSESEEYPSQRSLGKVEPTGYTFEHAWELVPGRWTIQVIYESKVWVEKSFNVVVAN